MHFSRRWGLGATMAVVTVAGTAATGISMAGSTPATEAVAAPATARPAANRAAEHTVTLVTGDRVTVSADGQASAQPGPRRKKIIFDITTLGGRIQVIPSDAKPLLASGRLDPRLFDVTGLIESGYDRRDKLPLIVTGTTATVAGLAKERDLPAVKGMAVRQPRGKAADSWRALTGTTMLRSAKTKVWLDATRRPSLDVSVPQIGAPAAWQAGYSGTGTTVAVLDTGIDGTHPDLTGQVVGRQNFTEEFEPDNDLAGHGTHVASTIAGTGAASGGKYKGVAPGAKLLDAKVCVDGGCLDSWILAGMTWAAADQHAKVVNMSLGGEDDPTVVDPIEEAVQTLSDRYGTLFVVSAGNALGVVEGAIESPGTAEAALTVGAVDDNDDVAEFSRRGLTGDGRLKPDIVAPGVDITAARGKDAGAVPGKPGDTYTQLSGTSMAAPHVAGAAAILAQEHPDWSGPQLKAALTASAKPNPALGVHTQGSGRVDVARAIGQQVSTAPTGVSFGEQMWPHQDDQVQTREVTYRNDGSAEITLNLKLDTDNPDGSPTPDGMFTIDKTSVVVPAGGDAKVTVTADTRVPGPDGYLGGWLTATAAEQVVRTPLAVEKEVESYEVTLVHSDRNGDTPSSFNTMIVKRDTSSVFIRWHGSDPDNAFTVRLPKGHYSVVSAVGTLIGTDDSGGKPVMLESETLLARPDLEVDHTLSVDLDARLGKPVSVTIPHPSAQQIVAFVSAQTIVPARDPGATVGMGTYIQAGSFANIYTAQIGPDTSDDNFASMVGGQWARVNADGGTDDSPYLYSLLFPEGGRLVTGYQRRVADRELAKVRADFAASRPGTMGYQRVNMGLSRTKSGFSYSAGFHLPFSRIEYYNTHAEVRSAGIFMELLDDVQLAGAYSEPGVQYHPGRTYHERWNTGVFSPSLPAASVDEYDGVRRAADTIEVDVPMFGDGAGHAGVTLADSFSATLFRDGVKVGNTEAHRWASFDVPADEAPYRLVLHAERGEPFALSTKIDTAWTFRSGHVGSVTPAPLPLWTVGFSPKVDKSNTTPAGTVQTVPVHVVSQPGSDAGELVSHTVEASFDDGATWHAVPVKDGEALVSQPAGSGFVSLRAKALDSDGNTVEQTVIRAYRYKDRS